MVNNLRGKCSGGTNIMTIRIPQQVEYILNKLMEHGYEAYAVGGCVRDVLLGRTPGDWDITTSAKPYQVKELFRRTIDTGIEHGTVTIMLEKQGYEVTTYRIDGEYLDSRHPSNVEFTDKLSEDLRRRDFTINAMAYNSITGIVDLYDGLSDLQKGIIRCVGNPEHRFDEDALRIMRAVRFAAQLGFIIDEETKNAIRVKVEHLKMISAERIRAELSKLIMAPNPELIYLAYELGITQIALPEFDMMLKTKQNNPHHSYNVGEHSIVALRHIIEYKSAAQEEQLFLDSKHYEIMCYAALLHDVGKPLCKSTDNNGIDHFHGHSQKSLEISQEILKRLKCDNYMISMVGKLVKYHDMRLQPDMFMVRKATSELGKDLMPYLFLLQEADIYAQNPDTHQEKLQKLFAVKQCYIKICEDGDCVNIKELAINGDDLIKMGFKPGKGLGEVLNGLLNEVIAHPDWNTKENLIMLSQTKLEH